MKHDNQLVGLSIALNVIVMLLLLFILSITIGNNKRTNESLDKITQKVEMLQQQHIDNRSNSRTPTTATPSPAESSRWLNRARPFPLNPDPYFQNFVQPKNRNMTLVYRVKSSEKGFNRVLENAAQIAEWHDYYVNDWLAQRHWEDPEQWAPHLAERIEVSDDSKEFTIYLRSGVKWHKPLVNTDEPPYQWLKGDHHVTSHDFYFAYTTIINSNVMASHLRPYYEDIQSFEIIDDYVFIVRWKKTLYTNISYTMEFFPLPKFLFSKDKNGSEFNSATFGLEFNKHWYNDRMIGCGPYVFAENKPDEYIELARNDEFYGFRPPSQRIRFAIVRDDNTAYMKLKGGEMNVIYLLPEHVYRDDVYKGNDSSPFKQGKLKDQVYTRQTYYHIKWNNSHQIFRNKMVRRAMTYAFDREGILKNIYMGLGVIATSEIPSHSKFYNKKITPYPYDLKKARKILEDEGWRDEDGDGVLEAIIDGKKTKLEFTLYYAGVVDTFRQMYEIYKDDLLKIGVRMNPQGVEWAVLLKKSEDKDFEAMNGVWTTSIPLDFYQIWHSKFADVAQSSNHIRFKNDAVDEICQKMREAIDLEERVRLAHRIQEIWHEEQPYTFLFYRNGVAAYTSNVQNRFIRQIQPHTLVHPCYIEMK